MALRSPRLHGWLLAVLLVTSLCAAGQRVVAVGDVHGNLDGFAAILQRAAVIDADRHWRGGNTVLVQTGDFLDRGDHDREVMDLLMALEKEAPRSGGRVIVLLGNHEIVNLVGDMRYVAPAGFAEFAGKRSAKLRSAAYRQYCAWARRRATTSADSALPESEAQWNAGHPLGLVERREQFSPQGKYGRWLRQRPAVATVGDLLFVHGGIDPDLPVLSPAELNRRAREEIQSFDQLAKDFDARGLVPPLFTVLDVNAAAKAEIEQGATDPQQRVRLEELLNRNWVDGPFWFRGYSEWDEEDGRRRLAKVLAGTGARHIIAGHTPQPKYSIRQRFGGGAFLIDTGLGFPEGRPSALEIDQGRFTAIYLDERKQLLDTSAGQSQDRADRDTKGGGISQDVQPASTASDAPLRRFPGRDGQPLPFRNDDEVIDFLRGAVLIESKSARQGTTAPKELLLEAKGVRARAIFRYGQTEMRNMELSGGVRVLYLRDDFSFEPAAYELGRLLDIHNVPPALLRNVQGRNGSVQFWIEGAFSEQHRRSHKIKPPNVRRWNRQIEQMHLFDNLIRNEDRHSNNILIDGQWNVWYVDHTRAFQWTTDLQDASRIVTCERHVWERLRNLSDAEIRSRLRPYVSNTGVDSLLKRRQKIVKHIQALIAKKGEDKVLFAWSDVGGEPTVAERATQAEPSSR